MGIVGNIYLERGEPVEILAQWVYPHEVRVEEDRGSVMIRWDHGIYHPKRGGPRNVLIRRRSGDVVVRPFRGLRKLTAGGNE